MMAIFFSRPLTLTIISFGICVKPSPEFDVPRAPRCGAVRRKAGLLVGWPAVCGRVRRAAAPAGAWWRDGVVSERAWRRAHVVAASARAHTRRRDPKRRARRPDGGGAR